MKTKKYSRTARVVKKVFDVRSWADYDRMKTFTLYLGNGIKKMVVPQKTSVADKKISFKKMSTAMNLSEEVLTARANNLYRFSMFMCFVALCVFGYAVYHLVYGNMKATLVSFVVTGLALVMAFRYHYWYFQIKERKLGCTLYEWYRQGLLGDKE